MDRAEIVAREAPRTPLCRLASTEDFKPEPGRRYTLIIYRTQEKDSYVVLHDWCEVQIFSLDSGKLLETAACSFFALRALDPCGAAESVAEPVPGHGVGIAIPHRSRRFVISQPCRSSSP